MANKKTVLERKELEERIKNTLLELNKVDEGFIDRLLARTKGSASNLKTLGKNIGQVYNAVTKGEQPNLQDPKLVKAATMAAHKVGTYDKKLGKVVKDMLSDLEALFGEGLKNAPPELKQHLGNLGETTKKFLEVVKGVQGVAQKMVQSPEMMSQVQQQQQQQPEETPLDRVAKNAMPPPAPGAEKKTEPPKGEPAVGAGFSGGSQQSEPPPAPPAAKQPDPSPFRGGPPMSGASHKPIDLKKYGFNPKEPATPSPEDNGPLDLGKYGFNPNEPSAGTPPTSVQKVSKPKKKAGAMSTPTPEAPVAAPSSELPPIKDPDAAKQMQHANNIVQQYKDKQATQKTPDARQQAADLFKQYKAQGAEPVQKKKIKEYDDMRPMFERFFRK